MSSQESMEISNSEESQSRRLSYKFQRLRERLRTAISSGELIGKLPGERVLARRFKVNAKTLSKALTDLAAEGLLERNIGLGTFVRGATVPRAEHRCLVLQDPDEPLCPIAGLLQGEDLQISTHDDPLNLPPSLLNPHRSVVICSQGISDDLLRDLVVRGKSVVLVDRLLTPYATHAVLFDRVGAAVNLLRRFAQSGHKNILLVDGVADRSVFEEALSRMPNGLLTIHRSSLDDIASAVSAGVTALLCGSDETGRHAMDVCRSLGLNVPEQVSVAALGMASQSPACSGQYLSMTSIADSVRHLLLNATPHKPITLWLSGEFTDVETIAPLPFAHGDRA
ncbi:MAG TPA: GntR family transcriptional regulator [Tepidisphaeraceae bacterium]|jgi:hypothetical protein